ncbi:aminoglycoside phosphotransferase family protein [Actinoplanes palleronii]|uniref:Aminoglycoside O-phosphotransferase n=1 Tax=Actinoplanes palleronii TaxID=113570 RepID=A0ABQ4BR03_9ACTN|nr:aminoglycoside phosphotransferase family protein [Actinoplanes palleronii]GIE73124.1 aminoglycoside O-phosphotransferase [Actinoplanes palleronii]
MPSRRRPITVPEEFAAWRIRLDGAGGRDWIATLPDRVEDLLDRWCLTLDGTPPLHGSQALVLMVTRDDRRLALKVSAPQDRTTAQEAIGLRAWNGHGTVELLADEPGTLLLERLDHTRTLHAVPLTTAAEIAGTLIRTLAIPPPPGVPALPDVAAGIAETLKARQRKLGDPVPDRWLCEAMRYAGELPSAGAPVLIHADLHYGNILAGTRTPWLAIDPRPLAGTPEYSIPELLWTRADDLHAPADVHHLLSVLVDTAALNPELARGWAITRCVDYWLWGTEHGLTLDPPRTAKILSALLPL